LPTLVVDVLCGSFATVWSVASHFRSSPNSGHNQIASACLKSAKSRHSALFANCHLAVSSVGDTAHL